MNMHISHIHGSWKISVQQQHLHKTLNRLFNTNEFKNNRNKKTGYVRVNICSHDGHRTANQTQFTRVQHTYETEM